MRRAASVTPLWVFGLSLLASQGLAGTGKYGASFLDFGVGARAVALGGAPVAAVDDGSAFYWNVAGLAHITSTRVDFMYATAFGSVANPLATYNHVGASFPLGRTAALAANVVRLAVDDIPIFPELPGNGFGQRLLDPSLRPDGQPLGYFSDREEALVLSFAKMNTITVSPGWLYSDFGVEIPFGISFRMVRQRLYGASATGFGVDLGGMLRVGLNELLDVPTLGTLSAGLAAINIGGTALTWNTRHQDRIAEDIRHGLAYRQPLPWNRSSVLVCWAKNRRPARVDHWGLEYEIGWVAVRLGLDGGRFTAGAGFDFRRFTVDYGFVSSDLGNVHRLSGSIALGRKKQE